MSYNTINSNENIILNSVKTTQNQILPIHNSEFRTQWKNNLWYSYNDYLTKRFGEKVYKITVSGGFTCPTRDGSKGYAGCAYCDEHGSASYFSNERAELEIQKQIDAALPAVMKKYKANKFLAYFQSYTNTYANVDYLKKVYDGAFYHPKIDGLIIGTRADAISKESIYLLSKYAKEKYVSLEIGVQSFDQEVLDFYLRGEKIDEIISTINWIKNNFSNIELSIHLMFGAPKEIEEGIDGLKKRMIDAAFKVNQLNVDGVKLHQLMVLKKTVLEKKYAVKKYPFITLEDYNEGVKTFLENLNPKIFIERTHALSSHPDELVGPKWSSNKLLMRNSLTKLMTQSNSYQGKEFLALSNRIKT
jgi:hypothetical protein